MSDLLDASVWVPLSYSDHPHNRAAKRYWEHDATDPIVFCRVTALALLRHLTNRHVMQEGVLTASGAWLLYERWRNESSVVFHTDPAGVDDQLKQLSQQATLTTRLWTDAYLAAFAIAAGLRLVSFDRDFTRFPGLDLLLLEA